MLVAQNRFCVSSMIAFFHFLYTFSFEVGMFSLSVSYSLF